MAKFIYRMQNILNLKLKLEEQQKMEFAAARKRLDEEEEKLELLQGHPAFLLTKAEHSPAWGRRGAWLRDSAWVCSFKVLFPPRKICDVRPASGSNAAGFQGKNAGIYIL